MSVLLVMLGGAFGAVLRFVVDAELKGRIGRSSSRLVEGFPVSTLFINTVGSGVLGAVDAAHTRAALTAFIGTGICGGFTTFSTASVEALTLVRQRNAGLAIMYAALTLVWCCLACWAGAQLG